MFRLSIRSIVSEKLLFHHFTKMSSAEGPIQKIIHQQLNGKFNPVFLEILNESYMHNVPKGSESHFKVVVVSDQFEGLPLIKRHRMINEALKEELSTSIHALSITAKTPSQWKQNSTIPTSPPCLGGSNR